MNKELDSQPINLLERFGKRYRVSYDAAYNPKGKPRSSRDPWMMQIKGRYGTVYPYGGELLCLEIDGHNKLANKIAKLPGITVHQEGEDERTLLFDVSLFEKIARIVKLKRRRRLTEEQRREKAARLAAVRSTVTDKKAG